MLKLPWRSILNNEKFKGMLNVEFWILNESFAARDHLKQDRSLLKRGMPVGQGDNQIVHTKCVHNSTFNIQNSKLFKVCS